MTHISNFEYAGHWQHVSSEEERRAHNPEVPRSKLGHATLAAQILFFLPYFVF